MESLKVAAGVAGGLSTRGSIKIDLNKDFSLKILFGGEFGVKDLDILETLNTGLFGRTRLVKSLKDKKYYSLKVLKKGKIVKQNQLGHVQNELKIMSRLRCPFASDMKAVFQDESCVYMLYDYIPGGELFSHLRKAVRYELEVYQFYAMEIACALDYLHSLDIIYRDLKPENICLSREGHIRLTEFSFAKIVPERTYTILGTPEYAAPEMIMCGTAKGFKAKKGGKSGGYGSSVDYWALGILIYEMCMGYPPFFGKNPFSVYTKILEGKIDFSNPAPLPPPVSSNIASGAANENTAPAVPASTSKPYFISSSTQSLVKALLNPERTRRLGCGSRGFSEVKSHAFFRGILDWNLAHHELVVPPVVPTVVHEGDSSNYDYYEEDGTDEQISLSLQERQLFSMIDEILERPKMS